MVHAELQETKRKQAEIECKVSIIYMTSSTHNPAHIMVQKYHLYPERLCTTQISQMHFHVFLWVTVCGFLQENIFILPLIFQILYIHHISLGFC